MVLKLLSSLFFLLVSAAAYSHPLDVGYMHIKADSSKESIFTSIEIHPSLVKTRNFFHETLGRSNWSAGNRKCKWREGKAMALNSETLKISARAECPGLSSRDRLSLDLRFLETSTPDVKIFIRAITPDYESTLVINKFNHFIKMAPTIKAGFIEYTLLGIEALGISPNTWSEGSLFHIPFGLNQLFLIVLMIATVHSRRDLFYHLGGFTLALSAALSWVSFRAHGLESRYIDILIAFGLLYFSLDVLFLHKGFRRIIFCILLGVVHGFKLGELLLGFDLPQTIIPKALTGFLFGIVCAQMIVILIFSPALAAIKKYSFVRVPVHTAAALMIAVIGTLWLFEKTTFMFA